VELDFTAKYHLENEAVLLRPLEADDWLHLLPYSLNEPDLWKYSLVPVAGEENLRNYVIAAVRARAEQKEYPFIVFDKRAQAYAGSTRFYDIQKSFRTLQLGYTWYGKKFQGTGLNRHCKYLLLDFAFGQLNMLRVEFRADNNNARSIAAMKSIGCVPEGVLRQNVPTAGGGRRDSIVLSILQHEWQDTVKSNLAGKIAGGR
jgi:N-acetyltransferase